MPLVTYNLSTEWGNVNTASRDLHPTVRIRSERLKKLQDGYFQQRNLCYSQHQQNNSLINLATFSG